MMEYRLYFLDPKGHIIARLEFVARDDATALHVAACIADQSSDKHAGYTLWRAGRQVFATDEGGNLLFARAIASKPLSAEARELVLALEEELLSSHWCLARSQRLLAATSRSREVLLAS